MASVIAGRGLHTKGRPFVRGCPLFRRQDAKDRLHSTVHNDVAVPIDAISIERTPLTEPHLELGQSRPA